MQAFRRFSTAPQQAAVSTGTCAGISIPDASIDYIFTDPPFGENIYYADLNFLVEAWYRVRTDADPEAIVDQAKHKDLADYQELMRACFAEYFRVLKPGRWMTVVFHNSRNAVWNAIQEAMLAAGFVVADVRTMDKQQGSYRQVTSTAMKQDLVISAYRPSAAVEDRFKLMASSEEDAWAFVRSHLRQLPVFVRATNGQAEVIAERRAYMLYDRMVAFHVQRGISVPLSAAAFSAGLSQRFPERDGMYFLPDQVAEYDKKRMTVREILQLQLLVTDEASTIQWIRQELERKPQTYQELFPKFLKAMGGWSKHEQQVELSKVLEENFLRYGGTGPIPEQLWSWMLKSSILREQMRGQERETASATLRTEGRDRWFVPNPDEAQDREQLRERALLRIFDEYKAFGGRVLKSFRLEAVRVGFKKAWTERDYQTIIAVARKVPEDVLQEDPKLLMWYDQAQTRAGTA